MSHQLHTAEDLHRIQKRLEELCGFTERVANRLDSMDRKVDRMLKAIENRGQHAAHVLRRREMPTIPRFFHGRNDIVDDVARLLTSREKARVCVLGPGGMGKTSVAVTVMQNEAVGKTFKEENRFWVSCIDAKSPGLLLQVLYSGLRITQDTGDALADIRSELQICPDSRLLVLDNFETPWHPREGHQREVKEILCSLTSLPHLSILVTMRSNFPPSEEIAWEERMLQSTDEEASRLIYTDIDPAAIDHPALPDLLCALDHMPFAITLMATMGKKSKSPPDELLKMWHEGGTDMLSEPEEGMNHCISLSVDNEYVAGNPEASTLLATLSMLPAGADYRHLEWWAPSLKNRAKAVATLNEAALVMDRDDGQGSAVIYVLPVVQSYMHRGDRISQPIRHNVQAACYQFIKKHKSLPGDPTFLDDLKALASEETNIQVILLEAAAQTESSIQSTSSPKINVATNSLLEALLTFSWFQRWSKHRVDVAERTIALAWTLNQEYHLAEALFCLGCTLKEIDRYSDAVNSFKKARECFRSLPNGPDLFRAGQCGLELCDAYQYMQKSLLAEDVLLEAQDDLKKSGREYGVALGLLTLGGLHFYMNEDDEALKQFDAAKTAFERLHRPVDVANCLHDAARSYAMLERYLEALDASEHALRAFDQFGLTHKLCEAMIRKARYLKMLDRDDDAMEILPRTLEECQRLGSPLLIAQTLEEFGEVCANKTNHSAARAAYERAQEQYESMGRTSLGRDGARRCRHNISRLILMEDDPAGNTLHLKPSARY
jgi:tetratricopeptide (TPR) repeat protein